MSGRKKDEDDVMTGLQVFSATLPIQVVIQPVAEVTSRRRLRSSSSSALLESVTPRPTTGDRAFVVAGPRRAWNR